jgi:FG-GAP-like repeat/ASPIC and UnbV
VSTSRGVLLIVSLPWALACGDGGDSAPNQGAVEAVQSEGTRAMAERLARLPAEVDLRSASSMNRERLQHLQGVPKPQALGARFDLWKLIGGETLRSGSYVRAEAVFDSILSEVDALGPRVPVAYRRSVEQLLAFTYLRQAIHEQCVLPGRTDRCMLPVPGTGMPGGYEGVELLDRALEVLEPLLAEASDDPESVFSRWLLNLAHGLRGSYPDSVPEELRIPWPLTNNTSLPRFEEVAGGLGLDLMGQAGGSIMDDLDGDGDLDLFISSFHFTDQLRYFVNLGDGSFEDRSEAAGLTGLVGGLTFRHGDYDNDGDIDIFVLRGGWERDEGQPNSLLRNNGDGTFDDVTEEAGLLEYAPTQAGAWADYDGDGWLDLFVGAEAEMREAPPKAYRSRLFRNRGDGTFEDVSEATGLVILGFVKAAVWGDYDNDGSPDLFVSRFDESNLLFRNPGDWPAPGRFEEVGGQAGVRDPRQSFQSWFWDYDNDGWLDLMVFNFSFDPWDEVLSYLDQPFGSDTPRLYRNRGDGTFEDATPVTLLDRLFFTMGSDFGDLDNDGFLDFYAGTGLPPMSVLLPNRMYRNLGGRGFEDVSASGFAHLGKGHGVSFGDIDNDGDQDVYAVMGGANQGDRYRNVLFENPGNDNDWITLRLEGTIANRSAVGARVRVVVQKADGTERSIYNYVGLPGSFGGSSLQQEIGLGSADSIVLVEIVWPGSGKVEVFRDAEMNRVYRIVEGEGRLRPVAVVPFSLR